MKVLEISDVYFPRINGVSISIAIFRRELIDRGHQVTLLAPGYGGVPVVSTAVLGTRDIVEPRRGALLAEEELDDFAGKVTELLRDPGRRRTMSQQALEFAEGWSSRVMTGRLETLYREVVDGGGERPGR